MHWIFIGQGDTDAKHDIWMECDTLNPTVTLKIKVFVR